VAIVGGDAVGAENTVSAPPESEEKLDNGT
jgi:hypothetical protein